MIEKKGKYPVDFSSIDNQHEAYILGLLSADGRIATSGRAASLKLHIQDLDIIEKIRNYVCPECNINMYENHNDNRTAVAELNISCVRIVKNLKQYGIVPNKTSTIRLPSLRSDLYRHYLRGYLDGDGTVYYHKDRPFCGFVGNLHMISDIKSLLCGVLDMNLKVFQVGALSYQVTACSYNAILILRYLFKHSRIHGDRKYSKISHLLKGDLPDNIRIPWSSDEDTYVLKFLEGSLSRSKLHSCLKNRSKSAIYRRIVRLRKDNG